MSDDKINKLNIRVDTICNIYDKRISELEKKFKEHNIFHKSLNSGEMRPIWLDKEIDELREQIENIWKYLPSDLGEQLNELKELAGMKRKQVERIDALEKVLRELKPFLLHIDNRLNYNMKEFMALRVQVPYPTRNRPNLLNV